MFKLNTFCLEQELYYLDAKVGRNDNWATDVMFCVLSILSFVLINYLDLN